MQNKSGSLWIKRQQNIFNAIKNKQGRFAKMSESARIKMLEQIEIDVFGIKRFIRLRQEKFLLWFKQTFGYKYNEMR